VRYLLPVLQKVISYVAELLRRNFENQEDLLLYLNKTVKMPPHLEN
jgi:hypothetical protein